MAVENKYKVKDEALFAEVQKLKDGASGDYNLLYELSEKYIYKIINDIVKNHHTTEDLMQETYLQIYNKIDTLQDAKAFYVWAGRIATNLTLRHVQKYRKETLAVADEEGSTDFVFDVATDDNECFIPENVLMDKEKQRLIAEIIDSLSVEQKLSVQYFYYEEMSVRDIAQVMGCSEGTVKSRLNYARKSIKDAVIDLDVKQGTRLYSLGTMPLFWLVFRESVEALVLAGTAAVATATGVAGAVAGSVGSTGGSVAAGVAGSIGGAGGVVGSAGTVAGGASSVGAGGTVAGSAASSVSTVAGAVGGGTGSSVTGAVTSSAGSSVVAGTTSTGAASVGASTGATGAATAGAASTGATTAATAGTTKAATGLAAKFFGTAAGKAVAGIAAAAVVIGGGAAVMNQMDEPAKNEDSVTEEAVDGRIVFYHRGDPTNPDIWAEPDITATIMLRDENSHGYYFIYEDVDESSQDMRDLYDIMLSSVTLEESKEIFEQYHEEATNVAEEGSRWNSTDVVKDMNFPETMEFEIDGIKVTFEVDSIYAKIDYVGYHDEFSNYSTYTSFYKETNSDSAVKEWHARGVGYIIDGSYTCDGDLLQCKYAKDENHNYLYGKPTEEDTGGGESNEPVLVTPIDTPKPTEEPIVEMQEGFIKYVYDLDAKKQNYWAERKEYASVNFKHEDGHYVVRENMTNFPDEFTTLYPILNSELPSEKAEAFFEQYQAVSLEENNIGGQFKVDVTEEFPESLEFDFDGMLITFKVEKVTASITTNMYYAETDRNTQFYTSGVEGYSPEGEEVFFLAGGVEYKIEGEYVCNEDINQSKYAKDAKGNYLYGEPVMSQPTATPAPTATPETETTEE